MSFAEDKTVFLADFGETATYGAVTAQVIFDKHDEEVLHGRAQSTHYKITFNADDLVGLKRGDTLNVAGVGYAVHEVDVIDDGGFRTAVLYAT